VLRALCGTAPVSFSSCTYTWRLRSAPVSVCARTDACGLWSRGRVAGDRSADCGGGGRPGARAPPVRQPVSVHQDIFLAEHTRYSSVLFGPHAHLYGALCQVPQLHERTPRRRGAHTHTDTLGEGGGAISAPPLWRDVRVHWHCVCVLVCRSLAFTCGDPPSTQSGDDEAGAGRLERVRAAVVEVVSLYAARYHVDFPMLPAFIEAIWSLLGRTSLAGKNDLVRTGTHTQTDRQRVCVSDPHADSTQIPKHKHV
jgi:hypothetical protein